ncbi:hypothetical protein MAP00_005027 [Monascus purpureus]|nr:hypothetical protein MAP00_005027 [Monascus purpureus]
MKNMEKESHSESASHAENADHINTPSTLTQSPNIGPKIGTKGQIAGGKYLEALRNDEGKISRDIPLQEVDFDLPLTLTECVFHNDIEYIVLDYAPGDKEDPFNWSKGYKWFISSLLCLMTLFIGLATTAYNSGMAHMCEDLGAAIELGQLGLFTFNMTCALAPLFLAPFCELVGRQLATIIVCRALLGLFGCVGTILVGGTFDDMFIPEERAVPMALFSYIAILGTVGAPIYAGFIDQAIGWRWVEGIQGLSNIPLLIMVVLFLHETRGGVFLGKRAKRLRAATGDDRYVTRESIEAPNLKQMLYNSSVKAIKMLITEPVVFFFGLWISFAWFIAFLFLSVITISFSEKRHWGEGVAGLPYISLCIGTTLAFAMNFLQIKKYRSITASHPDQSTPPEARLYGAMCGALFLPIGLFIYSFTQYADLHWIGPNIGLACITFGIFFIFESCYSFTSDCYGPNASSAIAGQGFMRNTLGAVSPLFGAQFFHNVGSQYAGLILSIVGTALTLLPFILFKFGPQIRARSKLAIKRGGEAI